MKKREMGSNILGIAVVFAMIAVLLLGSPGIVDSAAGLDVVDTVGVTTQEQNNCGCDVSESIGFQNPAAEYCTRMGYEYRTVRTEAGERGICVLPNGDEVDAWAFYRGECATQFSYCAKMGWPVAAEAQGDSYSDKCSTCILPDGSQKTVSELLDLGSGGTVAVERLVDEGSDEVTVPAMQGELPESFDWRNKDGQDWVTPVKDQGICGSCWAFAAVGTVEAQYNIFTQDPALDLDLSEQYLVSECCDCGDCDGGATDCALRLVRDQGIPDEACFRYTQSDCACDQRCPDWSDRLYTIDATGFVSANVATIKEYLIDKGPLSAYMGIGSDFGGHFDEDGIYRCAVDHYTNHAVVIVGYDEAENCWIVKNSFGTGWGDDGYFKVGCDECAIEHYVYHAALDHTEEVVYKSSRIDDSAGGDGDGNAEPGESITMPVTLWNRSANTTFTDVGASLTCAPDPYISISDDSEEYGDLPAGNWATSADDYDFVVDPSCPAGHVVTFNLNITASNDGPWTDSFTRVIIVPPDVSNVSAALRTDGSGTVGISYDVSASGTVDVSVDYWDVLTGWHSCTEIAGDVGPGIDTGTGKAVIWDARAQGHRANIAGCKVRVMATGGGAQDSADSNAFTLDTDPPEIIHEEPGSSAVSVNSSIIIIFNEPMDASSAESAFLISPAVLGSFHWTGNRMTFDPTTSLADDTLYTVTVRSSAKDSIGNALDGNKNGIPEGSPIDDYIWTFETTNGKCFIATAAYGTPMTEEIQILRGFRDEYLLTSPLGQAFTNLYYRVSPPIAEFLTEHPSLKPIVRVALVPAVAISTVVINTSAAEKTVIFGSFVLISAAIAIWVTRWRGNIGGFHST